jgi:hypothetical protein
MITGLPGVVPPRFPVEKLQGVSVGAIFTWKGAPVESTQSLGLYVTSTHGGTVGATLA